MAIKENLIIDQGSEYSVTVIVNDENGDPMNLEGYTGRAQMRKSYSSSSSKDFTVSVANTGTVTLSMTSSYSANIVAGRYLYDIEIVSSSNAVTRVFEGIVTVSPEITR